MITTVVFDIGETLVRDDRYWASWADWLDVPRHTLSALVGAVVAQGRDNADALRLLRPGIDIEAEREAKDATAGYEEHLDETDLYADVRPGLAELTDAGYAVHIAGNQTARAAALLRTLDLPAVTVSTSGEWGAAKPDGAFFHRLLQVTQSPPPATLYVGDHPANDITPATRAGLRTCLIRRGPWGHLWADSADVAPDMTIGAVHELPALLAGTT
ncbi:HAD family hydrolase [Streptomyces sp. NPDC048172]|uniref:HAD family hydrolase n=1 Tax=Streptomyces sp. NPDC048172 TaxID=3365505 RepID=UPI00371EA2F4